MCGISGIYAYNDGPVHREQLLKVRDHMSSRGPDGAGIYLSRDERLGLAHRRHLKISAFETTWYMKNQLLRDTDWASMAHSLEARTPRDDIELLRSVVALSAGQTLTKADLASTPRKPLAADVLNRKPSGFSVPLALWLNQQDLGRPQAATSAGLDETPRELGREWGAWTRTVYAHYIS